MSGLDVTYKCGCPVVDAKRLNCPVHRQPLIVSLPYERPAPDPKVARRAEKVRAEIASRPKKREANTEFVQLTPPDVISRDCPITAREYQIAQMVYQGASDNAIALSLGISPNTVRAHIHNIATKVASQGYSPVTGELKPRYRIFHWFDRWSNGERSPTLPRSYVYFIQADGGGDNIKIGVSTDPHARMYMLQTGSPLKLKLLGFCPGTEELEKTLHVQLAKSRLHNEWFAPTEDVLGVIAEMLTRQQLDAA